MAAGAAVAVTYVGLVDPTQSGHYPSCPFLFLTGYYCPGCGSLRAVHALTHGDVDAALGHNVLTVAAVVGLFGIWAAWVWRRWHGEPRRRIAPPWSLHLLLIVLVLFAVARNLPVGSALAP